MNKIKLLTVFLCSLLLISCATKDLDGEFFKNYTAKQLLNFGETAIAKNNFKDSIKYFEAIDSLYPFDPEAQQGQLDVIYAYYKTEDYASANAAANRYINLHPVDQHADYAYYIKGVINFEKDRSLLQKVYTRKLAELDPTNLQEAFTNFEDLIKKFPKSIYAKNSAKHMLYIRNLLAEHELQIANFYFERKAYVAAVNRASYIVKHIGNAPQVPEALKLMIKSYRALGAANQANNALRILQLNFPNERV
jgi:outer membrane protein assembly factor BamD